MDILSSPTSGMDRAENEGGIDPFAPLPELDLDQALLEGGDEDISDINALVASLLRSKDRDVGRPRSGVGGPRQTAEGRLKADGAAERSSADGHIGPQSRQAECSLPLHERTQALPSVADDFIRNFLVRCRMRHTLDCFNQEWYSLKARGDLPAGDDTSLPDVYAQNEALHDEVEALRVQVAHAHEVAAKAQATWGRFRKERDVHRLHHKRVLNEKHALGVDLRRLRAHHDTLTPLVAELRAKAEAAIREKALARLERDRALAKVAAAEAQLRAAGVVTAATAGGSGSGSCSDGSLPHSLARSISSGSVLAGRRAAQQAGATGTHLGLRGGPSLGAVSGYTSASGGGGSASSAGGNGGGATLNPEQRLSQPSSLAGKAIHASVRRAAAQSAALAAEARLPAEDLVNPFLEVDFEPARTDRYAPAAVRSWAAHEAPVAGLAFHPSKPVIVTASDDRTWRLWAVRAPGQAGGVWAAPTPRSLGAQTPQQQHQQRDAPGFGRHSRSDTLGLDTDGDTASASGASDGRRGSGPAPSPGGFTSTTTGGVHAQPPPPAYELEGDAEMVMSGSGHRCWLADAAFNPSGTTLATACGDGVVKLWSLASSRCAHTLTEHVQAAWGLAWDTSGDFLATASADHTARVWDAATGKPRAALRGHVDAVNAVVWQPYSANVITASADKTVSIWDCRSGQCVQTFFGHSNAVADVAVTLRGDVIASADLDGWVRCWDLRMVCEWASGRVQQDGPVNGLSFDRSGSVLATACADGLVRVMGLPNTAAATSHAASALAGGGRSALDAGSSTATVNPDGMPALSLLTALRGHADAVQAVAFDPSSSYLASTGDDGTVRLWGEPS